MSSEIPVVLKPMGFAETKQGADAASGSLEKLGQKVVSLEKLGEVAKKLGPATLAMASLAFAAREAGELLDKSLGGVVERSDAAAKAVLAVRDAVRQARDGANAGSQSALAGRSPALVAAGAAGVDSQTAASVAKRYGVSLDEARKAIAAGGDLSSAYLMSVHTGEGLASASDRLFKQYRGAGIGPAGVAGFLASSGDYTSGNALKAEADAADGNPLVRKAREINAREIDRQLADETRAMGLPVTKARSPEVEAALAKAQEANRAVGSFATRESSLLRGAAGQGFWSTVYNAPSVWKALGNLDFEQGTANSAADRATVELIRLLRSEGIKTRPATREATSQ